MQVLPKLTKVTSWRYESEDGFAIERDDVRGGYYVYDNRPHTTRRVHRVDSLDEARRLLGQLR